MILSPKEDVKVSWTDLIEHEGFFNSDENVLTSLLVGHFFFFSILFSMFSNYPGTSSLQYHLTQTQVQ